MFGVPRIRTALFAALALGAASVGVAAAWPTGAGGDITINAGQVVRIPAGATADYRNITINSGGTLEIDEPMSWTYIGVSGDLIVNGTIKSKKSVSGGSFASLNAPDGYMMAGPTPVIFVGGQGGGAQGAHGAVGVYANGGGGAACNVAGGAPSPFSGGSGATGGHSVGGFFATGGPGGRFPSGAGTDGTNVVTNTVNNWHCGGGGGGGAHGISGGFLYVRVLGKLDATGGNFDFSGTAAGPGGNGGSGNCPCLQAVSYGGGGGGGGVGGNGGWVVLHVDGQYSPGNYSVDPGLGGAGGRGGGSVTVGPPFAQGGNNGARGVPGCFKIISQGINTNC
jgi:hypothetical protein